MVLRWYQLIVLNSAQNEIYLGQYDNIHSFLVGNLLEFISDSLSDENTTVQLHFNKTVGHSLPGPV